MSKHSRFEYSHTERYGNSGPIKVRIEPLSAEYLAWRLKMSNTEAEDLQAQRAENQRAKLPNLIGEFVINKLGYGPAALQKAHIAALVAHGQALGLPEQVYGGYRAWGLLWDGTLFGPHSDDAAQEIGHTRQFHAAQVRNWREQAGYAKNNPFDHMTRGEKPNQSAPILATFNKTMLEAPPTRMLDNPDNNPLITIFNKRVPTVDYDTALWQPKDGLAIEDTLQVIYHRGQV